MYLPLFVWGGVCVCLCFDVLSRFAISLKRKRELVALLLLSYICLVTVNVLWHSLTLPWVCLQCVILVFPDHTHLLFKLCNSKVNFGILYFAIFFTVNSAK